MQHQDYLLKIIEAVKILSLETFSFARKKISSTAASSQLPGTKDLHPLVSTLAQVLYQQCYCRIFRGDYHESSFSNQTDIPFKSVLSQANSTVEKWEKDWVIDHLMPTGQYVATKNGDYKFLYPGEFMAGEYKGIAPTVGTNVTIHCPKESFTLQPGFYFVFSNQVNNQQQLSTLIRYYWNVKHTGVSKLIDLLTTNLNKYSIPFTFKCLDNPSSYTRSDSAVLYISKPYYHIAAQVLEQVYPQIQDELNEEVPGFTKELRPGLGLAEDPSTGESFGMSRCALIAQGIFNAYVEDERAPERIMDFVNKSFAERGTRLEVPYLNYGSFDIYNFFESSKN